MTLVAFFVRLLARILEWVGSLFTRLSIVLSSIFPVLFSPAQLTRLTQRHYLLNYSEAFVTQGLDMLDAYLEPHELDLMDRHDVHTGRMLVMGAGYGREAVALARRGLTVVGADTNYAALRLAIRMAESAKVSARFQQADFLALPYAPASFNYALLSNTMYSAIPGRSQRQAWLKDLGRLLKPKGLLFLSFYSRPPHHQTSRFGAFHARLRILLAKLPGANRDYQMGDEYPGDSFAHFFQSERELREELDGAGAVLRELNWSHGFAVISYTPQEF